MKTLTLDQLLYATSEAKNRLDAQVQNGLKIEWDLDEYLRFKPNQLNIIFGHDQVGQT